MVNDVPALAWFLLSSMCRGRLRSRRPSRERGRWSTLSSQTNLTGASRSDRSYLRRSGYIGAEPDPSADWPPSFAPGTPLSPRPGASGRSLGSSCAAESLPPNLGRLTERRGEASSRAFFYGGLVGRKNTLTIMVQSLASMGHHDPVVGRRLLALLQRRRGQDLRQLPQRVPEPRVRELGVRAVANPVEVFIAYQLMFAIITPSLITGAFADRVTFRAYLIFLVGGRSSSTCERE